MSSIKSSLAVLLLTAFFTLSACSESQEKKEIYTLVTYNVENLFDADGIAVFNDYKAEDRDGNPQYTPADVLTKIRNIVRVMKEYNEGRGPDIIAMVELESDHSGERVYSDADAREFLKDYKDLTLSEMLGDAISEEIRDLPSELLLLKGFEDAGIEGYQLHFGEIERDEEGRPLTVQKNVLFSKFPVIREKSAIHPTDNARPILETHLNIKGRELIVFTNHWKSGASDPEMEEFRMQNAGVLRKRINEIRKAEPYTDFVIAGDLNSHYDQRVRNGFLTTAIVDVLGSSGNETDAAMGDTTRLYNLWYELAPDERGSDTYRGEWGTLMHILIPGGMYDIRGLYYIDNSFEVGDFGFNTYSASGQPNRWVSLFDGSGYSDHLPVSMKFSYATKEELKAGKGMRLIDPSVTDDKPANLRLIQYKKPVNFINEKDFLEADPRASGAYYDEYVYLSAEVNEDLKLLVNNIEYDIYSPAFDIDSVLSEQFSPGDSIKFYGRFSQYRGNWQFIIEDPSFIEKSR